MVGTVRAGSDVVFHAGYKSFVLLRNTIDLMGSIFRVKQNIEETMEFPFPNETDIANLDGEISTWTWIPERVSEGRILDGKMVTKDVVVVVGHRKDLTLTINPTCVHVQCCEHVANSLHLRLQV